MYLIVNENNEVGSWGLSLLSLQQIFPNTSFPINPSVEDLASLGVFLATGNQPNYDSKTQKIVEKAPSLVDGSWVRQWDVLSLSTEEIGAIKQATIEAIAAKRYEKEIEGKVFTDANNDSFIISTERDSQDKIANERLAVLTGLRTQPKSWKCYDLQLNKVVFRPTTNDEIISISSSVYEHVSACYAREEQLLAEVEAGTYTDSMLSQGWPV